MSASPDAVQDGTPPDGRHVLGAGWPIVAAKELADHVRSVRFTVLLLLIGLAAVGTVYAAAGSIRDAAPAATDDPALFLRLFTLAPARVPGFFQIVGLLAPLLGIAFGFDAVSGERAQGTLPRLLSQPIHRDDVINGKFAAALGVIVLMLVFLVLTVAGIGMLRLGISPTAAQVVRLAAWLLVLAVYVAFWLGVAMLASVGLRRAATSALVCIAAWLVLTLFSGLLVGLLADALAPVGPDATGAEVLDNAQLNQRLARLSPGTLYEEATIALLSPEVRSLGLLLPEQLDRAVPSILPVQESLLVAWPQVVVLVGLVCLCFAAAYVLFMRQEVRA